MHDGRPGTMLNLGDVIVNWGYPAIVLFVILGNIGVPVPEESILVVAGYLSWRGDLKLPLVVAIGVISAAAGDNIGFWIGRGYGRAAIERYARRLLVSPERLESVWRFVNRYGALGVVTARFIPGLRFMAGPFAGAAGLRPPVFVAANLIGAAIYVPYAVGIGFAVGYGLGGYVEHLRRVLGQAEYVVVLLAALAVALVLARRVLRETRAQAEASKNRAATPTTATTARQEGEPTASDLGTSARRKPAAR